MKFYRGSARGARTYLESDRSRVDDYYLAEGTGLATRVAATSTGVNAGSAEGGPGVLAGQRVGTLDGDAYEQWVAGYDVDAGEAKGRLRHDDQALRFVEVVVNGPKTWSLAAALHPEIATAYEAAQDRAAGEIIDWLAHQSTTRVGPRGRQVQVPVEKLEAAVVRHYTSRAGDPHRHLHLQVNARVYAAGGWRGIHSVGVVKSIEAINGIGHAAVACDPEFRQTLAAHGYTLDAKTGEVAQLAPYAGPFSARAAQVTRTSDRYEAGWRGEHPDQEPGRALRRTWDRRAWAQTRPDKVVPTDGAALEQRWVQELIDLGFTPPPPANGLATNTAEVGSLGLGTPFGRINRDAVADLVVVRLGGRRSSWNAADIRGEVERIIAGLDVIAPPLVRRELAEDLTTRAAQRCVPLLARGDVPADIRALTSPTVLAIEADLIDRLVARAEQPGSPDRIGPVVAGRGLDKAQRQVIAALAGTASLVVVEGAAGAGKTTTLAAARELLEMDQQRLVVVTPTLKAARVAAEQIGTDAFSAAWLVHQHGYRWDTDGHWTRVPTQDHWGRNASGYATGYAVGDARARLLPGDLLLVDEAGMLDQDTASALLTIADETGARIAFVGDRHQLPAVGRGGVLDHAARWAHPDTCLALETVHRFTDPEYADLTLLMRTGQQPSAVFDALLERDLIVLHPTETQRLAAITDLAANGTSSGGAGGRVIADTREQVTALNAAIRDRRLATGDTIANGAVTTNAGELIGLGDTVTTRRNHRDLGVANRDTWTVAGTDDHGGLSVHGRGGDRVLPAAYVAQHVELAYATTVHGAQGETVDHAHLLVGEATGAAAAYVGMTRGRESNTAHLVASSVDEARAQWVEVFSRDRADLGPGHAAQTAAEELDLYGPQAPYWPQVTPPHRGNEPGPRPRPRPLPSTTPSRGYGPSR